MNLLASMSVAAFAINLAVGLFVLAHDRRRFSNQIFFLCGCTLAAWSLAVFVLSQPVSEPDALRWSRVTMACASVAVVLMLHLIVLLFRQPRPRLLAGAYMVGATLAGLSWFGLLDHGVRRVVGGTLDVRWYGVGNGLSTLLPVYAFMVGAYGVRILLTTARAAHGIRRAQAYYFLVGFVPCLLAGAHDFAGSYFATYPGTQVAFAPAFPLAAAFWSALVGYTVLRYRLIDLDAAITRGMVRTVTLAVLVIPFFLVLVAAQQAYHGEVYLDFSMLTLAICLLAAFTVPRLSQVAEQRIGAALLGTTRSYREALLALSNESTRILDLEALVARVTATLTTALGVRSAAVYVIDGPAGWRLGGQQGWESPRLPQLLHADHVLIEQLARLRQPAVREELELAREAGRGDGRLVDVMETIGAELAIPLITPEEMAGLVLLGPRDDGAVFAEEDLDVLTILANQLAVAMVNARLYADLKRSRELIQRSERLSAIGTMAAGLAHEIRNPLVSIRTFTQLLPERINDDEFRHSFLDLTLSEVDRICALINELLAFARPAPAELHRMEMNDCLDRICLLLDSQARNRNVRLHKRLFDEDLALTADEDQVKQVVMNVVLNAIQASADRPGGGQVEVACYPDTRDGADYVCIEISDNGCGIEPDLLPHIFDPFFTTRREGTGLGLSIAHQIVTRHGGFVDVHTDPVQGTTFQIYLPVEAHTTEQATPVYAAEDLRLHG